MAKKPTLPGPEDFFAAERQETVAQQQGEAVKPLDRKTARRPEQSPASAKDEPAHTIEPGFTEKVTFYVAPQILKRLELTRVQLLLDRNLKVSRSQIVEVILDEMVGQVEHTADLLENAAEY